MWRTLRGLGAGSRWLRGGGLMLVLGLLAVLPLLVLEADFHRTGTEPSPMT